MKKFLSVFLLCSMITVSSLTGCSSNKSVKNDSTNAATGTTATTATTATSEPEKIVLTIANWTEDPKDPNLEKNKKWKEAFEAKYPNITIKGDTWGYTVETFLPKAESGQLPNMFMTYFTEVNKIVDAGYVRDITDVMDKYGFSNSINPGVLDMVKSGGRIYGIPDSAYHLGLWVNVNLFKKAGLVDANGIPKFPRTYEELALTAQTIKEKTGKAGFFFPTQNNQGGWQFMDIAWSYGAEFEKKVDGKWKAVFNSPEAVNALQYLKDLKWKYNVLQNNVLTDINEMFKLFSTDQLGIAFGDVSWCNGQIGQYKISKDNFAMGAIPAGPNGAVSQSGGNVWMFSKNTTDDQLDAGLKYRIFTGNGPTPSQEELDNLEASNKSDNEKGLIVREDGREGDNLSIWSSPERNAAINKITKKYCNVNMALWDDYLKGANIKIKQEEPYNCQELYKQLDSVVQAVLTDKNADPKLLLDKAVADFQRDYLDKIN